MSNSRPNKATLDGMTLADAERKLTMYLESPTGRARIDEYREIKDKAHITVYEAALLSLGVIGSLRLVEIPNAVRVEAQVERATDAEVQTFMEFAAHPSTAFFGLFEAETKLYEKLILLDDTKKAWLFTEYRCEIWLPIAEDIVKFMSAGDVPITPTVPPEAKPTTPKTAYGPREETKDKIDYLKSLRAHGLKERGEAPKWTATCNTVGIEPETVKKLEPELARRWYHKKYLPD